MATDSGHKRSRSPDGSPCNHKENRHPEKEVRGPPSPARGRGKDKPDSTRAGRGFARPNSPQLKDRTTLPRRSAGTKDQGRCQDSPEAGPASSKRRRHLSPEVRAPLAVLTSRLFNQVDALQVVLDELRAPGGAFLPVPSRSTEPEASQRAWLGWQLAHAGANLHWAIASRHPAHCAAGAALSAALRSRGSVSLAGARPASVLVQSLCPRASQDSALPTPASKGPLATS